MRTANSFNHIALSRSTHGANDSTPEWVYGLNSNPHVGRERAQSRLEPEPAVHAIKQISATPLSIKVLDDTERNLVWAIRISAKNLFETDQDGTHSCSVSHFVEFYDTRVDESDLGQMVACIPLSACLAQLTLAQQGVILNTENPDWQLSAVAALKLCAWLQSRDIVLSAAHPAPSHEGRA